MGIASFFSRNAFGVLVLAGIGIFVVGFQKAGGVSAISSLGGGLGQLFGSSVGALERLGRFVSDFDPGLAIEGVDPDVIPAEQGGDQSIADAVQEAIDEGGLARDLPPFGDFDPLPSAEAFDPVQEKFTRDLVSALGEGRGTVIAITDPLGFDVEQVNELARAGGVTQIVFPDIEAGLPISQRRGFLEGEEAGAF